MKHLVFVYGTLKKGFGNHYLLKDAKFLGKARTEKKYKMTANGIPFVSKKEAISHIIGEVYEVGDEILRKLDFLEDHPNWYKREKVKVILENGRKLDVWLYFNEVSEGRYLISGGEFK